MLTLFAGLINWIVSTIFVESKLFEPVRSHIIHEAYYVTFQGVRHKCGGKHIFIYPEGTTEEETSQPYLWGPWAKLAQLVTCQLCVRVWVGFAEALYFGGPLHGWAALIANGLLYAGVGHLILELRSRVALVLPTPES